MRGTPTKNKEAQDPNRNGVGGPVSALKRRPPARGEASPSKQKKKAKLRSRRVSFAPDPELTMVHHFEKDEFSANSLLDGRPVLSRLEEQEDSQVVVVTERGGEAVEGEVGAYQPGFLGKTVPDGGLPGASLPLDSSPGMVSMEITQPVLAAAFGAAAGGEEDAAPGDDGLQQQQKEEEGWAAAAAVPGEVTAGLPRLFDLVEEDAYEEELAAADGQQEQGWAGAGDITLNNLTLNNITSGIPGLSSLLAEDEAEEGGSAAAAAEAPQEEVTAGMDLTVAEGRVLEHAAQQLQPAEQELAGEEQEAPQQPADPEPVPEPEAEPATGAGRRRRRSSIANLTNQRATQASKWGFAPGAEDTMDINLEMHGRMIMGDTTFNRMYGDNTTGDTTLGEPAAGATAPVLAADEDTEISPLPQRGMQQQADAGAAAAAEEGPQDSGDLLLSPAPSPAPEAAEPTQPLPAAAPQQQPNWQAPAFLPPYLQQPQQQMASDHPALVHSPADTNSTMNTLETRRISVGDMRRLSVGTTRRMSMQDATGRLLEDDYDDDLGLDLHAAPDQPTLAAGRRSDISLAGRDPTERLLADDDDDDLEDDQEDQGPLAGMKRQLRLLSQDALAPAPIEEEPELEAAEQEQAAAAPAAAKAACTPPRQAHSMGLADSSGGPLTTALLRSGGTTRLLQNTLHVKLDVQGPAVPARSAGGGTTKLLADMTMASMVGAKLRGQHTGVLGQHRFSQDAENGLTDYSLDGFDTPPELPGSGQQGEGAAQAAAGQPQQAASPEEQEGLGEEAAMEVEQEELEAQQQQQQQLTPPPAMQGYTGDIYGALPGDVIPGGPKLTRTPISVCPGASLRSQLAGTPHSVRSTRQQPQQASTPASAVRPSTSNATYPIPHDDTLDQIPGGPKLHRTPVCGRPGHIHFQPDQDGVAKTPLTGRLPPMGVVPGSAMAQHYPGTGQRLLGSALAARYQPGSAAAAHRLAGRGLTPLQQQASQPLPLTFQDFTKLMDVQFLDNLRRGASINYADMQRNPVPKSAQEAYTLLCAISPQVAVLENGIRILQELVQERRIKSAESENFIGLHNPSLFSEVQYADEGRLEELKGSVGLLKKLLRQKAVAELKAYRREMEEDKAHRLARNLELLQQDRALLEGNEQSILELARAVQQFVADEHRRMEGEVQGRQAEAERRQRVQAMREALAEAEGGSAQRAQKLEEAQARVAALKAQRSAVGREREALASKIQALEQRLVQTQSATAAAAGQSSPHALLEKTEHLEILTACAGWRLERLQQQGGGAAELALRLADIFRLQLRVGDGAATGGVELAADASARLPADQRQLAADLLAASGLGEIRVELTGAGVASLRAALQATSAQLRGIAQLLRELEGLRLGCPRLSQAAYAEGALHLTLLDLHTEVHFSVALRLPATYPAGEMPHTLSVRCDGDGHITEESVGAALAAVPAGGSGRLRAVCEAFSSLAASAPPPAPFFLRPPSPAPAHSPQASAPGQLLDANFQQWQNPLYGASASTSAMIG